MKDTQWYLMQAKKINSVRQQIHAARIDIDEQYRKKCIQNLTKEMLHWFLAVILPMPLIPLAMAVIKKETSW